MGDPFELEILSLNDLISALPDRLKAKYNIASISIYGDPELDPRCATIWAHRGAAAHDQFIEVVADIHLLASSKGPIPQSPRKSYPALIAVTGYDGIMNKTVTVWEYRDRNDFIVAVEPYD